MTVSVGVLVRVWRWLFGHQPRCHACISKNGSWNVVHPAYRYCLYGHCLDHCGTKCKCPLPDPKAIPALSSVPAEGGKLLRWR